MRRDKFTCSILIIIFDDDYYNNNNTQALTPLSMVFNKSSIIWGEFQSHWIRIGQSIQAKSITESLHCCNKSLVLYILQKE